MIETIHIVQPFERKGAGLMPRLPLQCESAALAAARAESIAATYAGVVAYSMDVDEAGGDYSEPIVLFLAGEVPDLA